MIAVQGFTLNPLYESIVDHWDLLAQVSEKIDLTNRKKIEYDWKIQFFDIFTENVDATRLGYYRKRPWNVHRLR